MNQNIAALAAIAGKPERKIIGLMSGTSVDGLDVALCSFRGHGTDTQLSLQAFETVPYTAAFREQVRAVFSKRQVDLEKVCVLNNWIALQHAAIVLDRLKKWGIDPKEVDLIASHGQTIYHAPKFLHPDDVFGNATLQIGDGDHLAVATGIITLSDFRQKHVAAGGEGAPLAVYGDYFIFSSTEENRIMLNIGGISNFTFLPASCDPTAVLSSDIGPGNTLMDAYIQQHFPGSFYDADATLAKQGVVNAPLLQALMAHPFFQTAFPKTIGPELFNLQYLAQALQVSGHAGASHADIMATLNCFTAMAIVEALQPYTKEEKTTAVYMSGGGIHNPVLMAHIRTALPNISIRDTSSLQIDPDAKEAILFAILANESVCGGQMEGGGKGFPAISMGKISFPH